MESDDEWDVLPRPVDVRLGGARRAKAAKAIIDEVALTMADGDEGMLQLFDMDAGDDGRDCDSEVSDDAIPPRDDFDVEDMPAELVTKMNAGRSSSILNTLKISS